MAALCHPGCLTILTRASSVVPTARVRKMLLGDMGTSRVANNWPRARLPAVMMTAAPHRRVRYLRMLDV